MDDFFLFFVAVLCFFKNLEIPVFFSPTKAVFGGSAAKMYYSVLFSGPFSHATTFFCVLISRNCLVCGVFLFFSMTRGLFRTFSGQTILQNRFFQVLKRRKIVLFFKISSKKIFRHIIYKFVDTKMDLKLNLQENILTTQNPKRKL